MSGFDLFCMRFALASFACLVAGLGVWPVAALCRKYLPALALQRSVWLLAQLAIAGTFIFALLPQTQTLTLRMVPAIEVDEEGRFASQEALAEAAPAWQKNAAASADPVAAVNWPLRAAQGWLLLYALGVAVALARLLRGQRAIGELLRAGVPLTAPHDHAGFSAATPAPAVIEVDAAISPMLIGLVQPRLLLPLQLRQFDAIQQRLIVAHELTHWRRHDLQWMGAALALQTLFWFHPIMRQLRQHLSWAQELACDRAVLQGRAPLERKAYAAALLAQLKIHSHPQATVLAFGGAGLHSIASRIALIRAPFSGKRTLLARCVALAGLAAVFMVNLVLQPALAWHADAPLPAMPAAPAVTATPVATARAAAAADGALDCTLIVDAASGKTLLSEGACDTRITPASTFNIVVSLMGFDSGILQDAHAPLLQYRAGGGFADWNPTWRRATDPTSWIVNSSAWYAQQVTAKLGEQRMAAYLDSFNYGNRDASGDPGKNNGLKMSWISSSMQISPVEQVAFLRKVANRQLPISAHAYDVSEQILAVPAGGGWQAWGKTGTAAPRLADGAVDQQHSYGWFVGWARKDGRTIVFARLLKDRDRAGSAAGPRLKQAFLKTLPARFDAL